MLHLAGTRGCADKVLTFARMPAGLHPVLRQAKLVPAGLQDVCCPCPDTSVTPYAGPIAAARPAGGLSFRVRAGAAARASRAEVPALGTPRDGAVVRLRACTTCAVDEPTGVEPASVVLAPRVLGGGTSLLRVRFPRQISMMFGALVRSNPVVATFGDPEMELAASEHTFYHGSVSAASRVEVSEGERRVFRVPGLRDARPVDGTGWNVEFDGFGVALTPTKDAVSPLLLRVRNRDGQIATARFYVTGKSTPSASASQRPPSGYIR